MPGTCVFPPLFPETKQSTGRDRTKIWLATIYIINACTFSLFTVFLSQIYKIRKREDMVGGSSRPELVRRNGSSFLFLPALLGTTLHSHSRTASKTSLDKGLSRHDSGNSGASLHSAASNSSTHNLHAAAAGGGIHRDTPLVFALKVINLKLVAGGPEKIDQLKNEVEILKTLDHRSIIKAYGTSDVGLDGAMRCCSSY